MSAWTSSVWTSRNVHFEVFPRETHQIEPLMDALVEHYWERGDLLRRLIEPGIGSSGRVVEVSGLPWWMPGWWARRTVAQIAAHIVGVGGTATFVIERSALVDPARSGEAAEPAPEATP